MADIVHEAQDTHLRALFTKAHGEDGDYEHALDAANSAAKQYWQNCQLLPHWPATPHKNSSKPKTSATPPNCLSKHSSPTATPTATSGK